MLCRFREIGLFGAALAFTVSALGSEVRVSDKFTQCLSTADAAASGIARLSASETAALDQVVAHDETLARQGAVTGFSTTFLERRTAQERAAAGIDHLTPDQSAKLDDLVARAIASGSAQAVFYQPAAVFPSEMTVPPLRPQIHGDVSFTIGGGKGGSFYGGSMDVIMTDPEGRYSAAVGFSEYRGRGCCLPWADSPLSWRGW